LGRHPDVAQACVAKPDTTPSEDALRPLRPRQRPGLCPSARGVVRRRAAACGTNKIDRTALVDRAAATYARASGRRV